MKSVTGAPLLLLWLASLAAFPAGAQTCTVPPGTPTITALSNFERTLTLSSNVLTTLTPAIPAATLAAITAGGVELREQVNLNPQTNVLTETFFTVAPGASTPTNLVQTNPSAIVATSAINVSLILVGSKPAPSALFVGTVSGSSASFFGPYIGAPATFSFGYTTDNPPKINNVTEMIAGTVVLYSPAASGSFTVSPPPPTTNPGPGSVTISVSGPGGVSPTNTFSSTVNIVTLDASASTSTNAGPLTFSWTPTPGFPIPGIGGGTTSPTIQLNGLLQGRTYQLMLTVTDSTGATATALVTVTFV